MSKDNNDKPVLLTEAVAFSNDGGIINQSFYSDVTDFQEQADYFESIFELFYNEPYIKGLVVIYNCFISARCFFYFCFIFCFIMP